MKSSFFKFLFILSSSIALIACGSGSSGGSANTYSAWMGMTVDDITNPTKLYISNFGTSAIKSVPIAGGSSSSMTNASPGFYGPQGLTLVGSELYVVDALNHAVRQVTTATPYTTITYVGTVGTSGNSDTSGTFYFPRNAVADLAGNLYVTDSGNNTVRKIEAGTKTVTTIASGFNNPWGIAIDNATQSLYVTDIGTNSIKKVTLAGAVTTFAGNMGGNSGLPTNAVGTAAYFNYPLGITTDGSYLYVVDGGNNAIRRIDLATQDVLLIAGSSAGSSGSAVNATGTLATFSEPFAITYGGGFLYVSDQAGALIRKISTTTPYAVSAFTLN